MLGPEHAATVAVGSCRWRRRAAGSGIDANMSGCAARCCPPALPAASACRSTRTGLQILPVQTVLPGFRLVRPVRMVGWSRARDDMATSSAASVIRFVPESCDSVGRLPGTPLPSSEIQSVQRGSDRRACPTILPQPQHPIIAQDRRIRFLKGGKPSERGAAWQPQRT